MLSLMIIYIKSLSGEKSEYVVDDTMTTLMLKERVMIKIGIDHNQLRFIFKGMPMSDTVTLVNHDIKAGDVIHVISMLRG